MIAHLHPPAFVGMALVGPDHRILAVSDGFADILGCLPADLCGRTFETITHPDDVGLDSELASQLISGRIPQFEITKRYRHKQGHWVQIVLQATAIKDGKGRIVSGVAQIRPVNKPPEEFRDQRDEEIERIRRVMLSSGLS